MIDKLNIDVRRLRESENRISHPIDACHLGAVELKILDQGAAYRLNDVAFDLVLNPSGLMI